MRYKSTISLFICMFVLLCWQALAAAAPQAIVQGLRLSTANDRVRIVADTEGEVDYSVFTLKNPNRIVIDMQGAKLGPKAPKELKVDHQLVKSVRMAQFNPTTVRVVVESDVAPDGYDIFSIGARNDNKYRVVMDFGNINSAMTQPSSSKVAQTTAKKIDKKVDAKKLDKKKVDKSPAKSIATPTTKATLHPIQLAPPVNNTPINLNASDKEILKGKLITIDPGHGGPDSGAIGPTGLMEKEATLRIALRVADMLKASGARVFLTRREDVSLRPGDAPDADELQARVDVANNSNSDIFLSIHLDSFTAPGAHGTTGYYYSGGSDASRELADAIKRGVIKQIGTYDRGTDTSGFYVVKHTNMPATLLEVAFISNPDEEAMFRKQEYINKAAQGIYDGMVEYFRTHQ